MLSSSHPELAAFLEESIMGQCEPSGSEPVSVAVEERASPGNMSCGNNSLEPEGPDVHLLYLSRRAALRGRKLVRSRPGPALAGADGCSSAGPCPDRYRDHHELLVNLKSLMRAHMEKLAAGVEVPSHLPSHFQQQLGTAPNGDLLQSPSTLGKANRTATLQNCSVPNPVTGSACSAALTNTSSSDFQGEVRLDIACQLLEEMLSCNPEVATFLEESIMGQCEPSGSEPVSVAVEERASPGNVSCGNNSLEPEGPDVHLLYLSRRAALRGRKLAKESL
ncbi:uncharacterized protein LOC126647178 isoform X1 [Myiozetetes cayanensis]|uniref:uncharacterized protein LOC126647178 isoform X1 n=1 Tax=Myiozetetes cayanensis TaxID=478635 RepID=UPI00215F5F7F|nr:uncharacterized protein LOC126647178 isoform X1 [Myiozetetes cayanensis]